MVGLGKTLVKEKRLFYETENLHKILYTITTTGLSNLLTLLPSIFHSITCNSFENSVSTLAPPFSTRTVSSIRTPPKPGR